MPQKLITYKIVNKSVCAFCEIRIATTTTKNVIKTLIGLVIFMYDNIQFDRNI